MKYIKVIARLLSPIIMPFIVIAPACAFIYLGYKAGIQYSYDRCMKYGTYFYYPDTYYCKLFAGKIKARDEVGTEP